MLRLLKISLLIKNITLTDDELSIMNMLCNRNQDEA